MTAVVYSTDHLLHTSPRPRDADVEEFDDYADVALRLLKRAQPKWYWPFGDGWLTTKDCLCPGWVLAELVELGEVRFRKMRHDSPNEWRLR